MRRLSIPLLLLSLACRTGPKDNADTAGLGGDADVDADGDGYLASEDCDDDDAVVHPGATEICDGVDNDCDDAVDEGVSTAFYGDADGDGYGDPETVDEACDRPAGFVESGTDCDDGDADVYPSAAERCDGVDNDCDGEIDEDVAGTWYADTDGDGFGDAGAPLDECDPPEGYVADATDCDDTTAASNPDAAEVCDELDNDCDGVVDEDVTTSFYGDADGDGYGDVDTVVEACATPSGFADAAGDCDDRDPAVNPGASELCNGVDDDCDGTLDESDAIDAATWYADTDGDGYGDASTDTTACAQPSGHVADDSDCDDSDAAVNPAASEVCNGLDDDCDGLADDADGDVDLSTGGTWWADADGDGYGDAGSPTTACAWPSGTVSDATDCDDGDAAVSPAGSEVCNGLDDDCDGLVDDADGSVDLATGGTWYADADLDGYGDAGASTRACTWPSGTVSDATDCDDAASDVNPAASEVCNGVDDDCDGLTDDADGSVDLSTASDWYPDDDGDGYGDAGSSTTACSPPSGAVSDDTDCDDGDSGVHPGADEVCDGSTDEDCDGSVDEDDAIDALTWYADDDGDGYGDPGDSTTACAAPSGTLADDSDCDDGDAAVNPGEDETCNGVDDDCDGTVDEDDAIDADTWYADADGDGYGDASSSTTACAEPSGHTDDDSDCDDSDALVHPLAGDAYGDGYDDDCDGLDCEADWVGSAYFAVCLDPETWSDGRGLCQAAGHGDLASVRSAGEQSGIAGLLQDAGGWGSKSPWIGFNDLDHDGSWVWSDGWTGSYTNWNSGEPNGGTTENCAELNWSLGTGRWNDSTCNDATLSKRSYVCQTR